MGWVGWWAGRWRVCLLVRCENHLQNIVLHSSKELSLLLIICNPPQSLARGRAAAATSKLPTRYKQRIVLHASFVVRTASDRNQHRKYKHHCLLPSRGRVLHVTPPPRANFSPHPDFAVIPRIPTLRTWHPKAPVRTFSSEKASVTNSHLPPMGLCVVLPACNGVLGEATTFSKRARGSVVRKLSADALTLLPASNSKSSASVEQQRPPAIR